MPSKQASSLSIQFGRNVARLREAREITQEQLAESAHIGWRYLQELERGKDTNPSLRIIHSLRDALECPWNELLGAEASVKSLDAGRQQS